VEKRAIVTVFLPLPLAREVWCGCIATRPHPKPLRGFDLSRERER
jgi:hypothetical protein